MSGIAVGRPDLRPRPGPGWSLRRPRRSMTHREVWPRPARSRRAEAGYSGTFGPRGTRNVAIIARPACPVHRREAAASEKAREATAAQESVAEEAQVIAGVASDGVLVEGHPQPRAVGHVDVAVLNQRRAVDEVVPDLQVQVVELHW